MQTMTQNLSMKLKMTTKIKIFLDLDQVFADLDKFIDENLVRAPGQRLDDVLWKELEKIPELFYRLELIPGSLQIITALYHQDLEFLTSSPRPTGYLSTAGADKRRWVEKHISRTIPVNVVRGGLSKADFLDRYPGAVLIDDYRPNLRAWVDKGGVGILHKNNEDTLSTLFSLGYA